MNALAPKKQETRVYLVENKECAVPKRLVRSSSPAQVARHVTKTMFTIRVADQDDFIELLTAESLANGMKVEDTDAEPEPVKPPEPPAIPPQFEHLKAGDIPAPCDGAIPSKVSSEFVAASEKHLFGDAS